MSDIYNPVKHIISMVGSTDRAARAIGRTPGHMANLATGTINEVIPGYFYAIAEFLSALPPEQWPDRWKRDEDEE